MATTLAEVVYERIGNVNGHIFELFDGASNLLQVTCWETEDDALIELTNRCCDFLFENYGGRRKYYCDYTEYSIAFLNVQRSINLTGLANVEGHCASSYHEAALGFVRGMASDLLKSLEMSAPAFSFCKSWADAYANEKLSEDKRTERDDYFTKYAYDFADHLAENRKGFADFHQRYASLDYDRIKALLTIEFAAISQLLGQMSCQLSASEDGDGGYAEEEEHQAEEIEVPRLHVRHEPTTKFQDRILNALDGRALKKDELARELKLSDPSRLYKPNGITELRELGLVDHKRGCGYWRPDKPPK